MRNRNSQGNVSRRRTGITQRPLRLEILESRSYLAAEIVGDVLEVLGTPGNDNISVGMSGEVYVVKVGRDRATFPIAGISSISVDGLAGNDRISISSKILIPATLIGGEGDDKLTGGGGDDVLRGDAGKDRLDGRKGNDDLSGGNDDDKLKGGTGDDQLDGDLGDDSLNGDAGDDNLHGGGGDDSLKGGRGNDDLFGDDGDDNLKGGVGDDGLDGGLGDDDLKGEAGDDRLDGGIDDDLLDGGSGDDDVLGGIGNDRLRGGRGRDHLEDFSGQNEFERDRHDDFNHLLELEADLRDGAFRADAHFEKELEDGGVVKSVFRARVKEGTPNTSVNVLVAGVLVGGIDIDAQGKGELRYSNFDGTPFPPGFPEILADTSVQIGTALGNLAIPPIVV